ncbi:Verrucotoxin subunit beta [Geodia barretti]|uniref:Verrucotoxin subunit beta n=1 Tax=Geodia barretti TaxID=519541 RepID=A0AA35TAD0_GEOBA|nr:Verrucotoxin subunit beta [Geodia barretti]
MSRGAKTTIELPCLGLPFQLGMLYDCRTDQMIPGMTLWDDKLLKAALSERPQPSSTFEVTAEDTISNKMFNLGVQANLSLSVLGGLVNVSGSAKYLDDRQSSSKQARVTLKYSCTSKFQQLTMEQLATSNIQHPDVFDKGTATHVVTAVLYGAEAFFIFDREIESGENYRNIHGNMEVLIKAIPGITEIKGSADLDISDRDKKEADKFQCKFYGDVILESNPSTFQDAISVYKELPKSFGKDGQNTVPKKVWLYPLSSLDSRAARMVREISTNLVSQTQQAIECLNNMVIRAHDLINNEVYDSFSGLKEQMSRFSEMVSEHKTEIMKQLCTILPSIRGGEAKEQELAQLLESRMYKSPFNKSSLELWLRGKEEEIKVLAQYYDIMKNAKGVKMLFAPGDLDAAINDVNHDHVLTFEFKVARKSDSASFLQNMFSFLRTRHVGSSLQDGSSSKQWYKTSAIIKDLRLKAKQFTTFAEANKGGEVMFVVSDSSEEDGPTTGGAVVLHYEFGAVKGEFEPPGQPKRPVAKGIKHDNVQLQWKAPPYGLDSIECYQVRYRRIDQTEGQLMTQKTKGTETTIVINNLEPETKYVFIVCAECVLGVSQESDLSETVETKPAPVNLVLQSIISKSDIMPGPSPPVVYRVKPRPVRLQKKQENIAKMEFGEPPHPAKPTKVLMVVGATGAGKSTLINGMVNYIFGVKWENDFRFKLICDEVSDSQAHSQTQNITAYTLYWQKGSPINFNLTIIDTPGFGDTRGLERDQQITKHIREFFQLKGRDGLDELHAIGFVTQASLARLTPTQKYISDSILSVFGKDIKDNIFVMTTFADGAEPPVMGAVREAEIPHADFFPFNNSALFVHPSKSTFAKMFWEMGYASLADFFVKFDQADGVSLQLTREVLEERHQLETIVLGIQPKINAGLSKIDELNQEEMILKDKESEILRNEDFTYEITVTKQRKIDAPRGTYVTNCANCHFTCHSSCVYDDDRHKWRCSAMDNGGESSAKCRVCPGNCTWRKHYNNGYHFELYEEVEIRTKQDLLEKYTQAKSAKADVESMIGKMENELKQLQMTVLYNISQARRCLQRLDDIALKPNPLTEVEYIDLLMKSEEQKKAPGWKKRIDYFQKVRQQAEILGKMKDPQDFEEMAKKSSKTVWESITGWFSSKKGHN